MCSLRGCPLRRALLGAVQDVARDIRGSRPIFDGRKICHLYQHLHVGSLRSITYRHFGGLKDLNSCKPHPCLNDVVAGTKQPHLSSKVLRFLSNAVSNRRNMDHLDWPYALLCLGVLTALGQARASDARLKRIQIQMRALLRHIDVVDPTALPSASTGVREALQQHGKFVAVRKYMEQTGLGIRECKEAVDELQEDAGRSHRPKK